MTTRLEQYQNLPQAVQDFLFDDEKEQEAEQVLIKDGVTPEAAFDLILLAEEVIFGTLPLAGLVPKVTELTKLPGDKTRIVARDLVTYRLLPLNAYVSGVDELMKTLGGDVKDAPVEHVEKESKTPERFVEESLKSANLHLSDPALESRLEFILASYVRGIRPLAQTLAALGRPLKVGGLELEEGQAKQLIELLNRRRGTFDVELEAEQKIEQRLVERKSEPTPISKLQTPKPPTPRLPARTTDVVQSGGPTPSTPAIPQTISSGPEVATEKIFQSILVFQIPGLTSTDLQKRLRNMILTRMKDLRSKDQTKKLLSEPVLTGGLALSPTDVDRVSAEIERVFEQTQQGLAKKAEEERAQYLEKKKKNEEERKARVMGEEEELTKRYVALTGKAPQPVAPVVPRLSSASLPPHPASLKPQMVDVKFVPKLAGPLEEIAQMRLQDFRRLASDPTEALMKVRDKIELLGSESYEKKVAGMKAWKASPINQLYLSMSQEALRTGKPAQAIVALWKEQGKEPLTAEEIKAIVQLNASLRF